MFEVGQMVVCIDNSNTPRRKWKGDKPIVGSIYTVTEIGLINVMFGTPINIRLQEIRNIPDIGYRQNRFRLVPKHSIQLFHDIANGLKQPEKENV